jgi:hypothetical protein
VIYRLLEGVRIQAVPHFTADGRRIALFVFASVAHPAVIEGYHPSAAGLGSLDRPTLDQSQLQASAVLEPGGGLALASGGASDHGGPSLVLLVRCDAQEQGEPRQQELRAWPLTAATSMGLDGGIPLGELSVLPWPGIGPMVDARRPLEPDHVIELLREATPGSWGGERTSMHFTGQHLIATNQPDVLARAGEILAGLEREILDPRVAEVTVLGIPAGGSVLDPAGGAGAAGATAELAALASSATVLSRVAVPMVSSREAYFLRGRESTILGDYEVEIAQSSAQADPVVRQVFSGIVGRIALTSPGDEPSASIQVIMTDSRMTRRALEERSIGVLDSDATSRVVFQRHHRFKDGEPLLLGEGVPLTVRGTAYRTLVQVSVRRR